MVRGGEQEHTEKARTKWTFQRLTHVKSGSFSTAWVEWWDVWALQVSFTRRLWYMQARGSSSVNQRDLQCMMWWRGLGGGRRGWARWLKLEILCEDSNLTRLVIHLTPTQLLFQFNHLQSSCMWERSSSHITLWWWRWCGKRQKVSSELPSSASFSLFERISTFLAFTHTHIKLLKVITSVVARFARSNHGKRLIT